MPCAGRLVRQMVVCLTLVLVWGQPGASATAAPSPAAWTVMVFLNGSDLETDGGAATADLLEMMQVGSTGQVNVVVETLGTAEWHNDAVDPDRNQRFLVGRGDPGSGGLKLVEDGLGLRRLADPATLADFIAWAAARYPAERYALILWNHGAGSVVGFGADEHDGGASLSVAGIREALQQAHDRTGVTLELVGFDACLMATAEVAYAVSPFARYMVASEEVEPGTGWDYATILRALARDPSMTGAELGGVIVDAYARHTREADEGSAPLVTLSVIDLSRVQRVVEALDAFVEAAGADIVEPDRLREFSQARRKSVSFGNDASGDESFDMVDIGDLVRQASALYPSEARAVQAALDEAVVHRMAGRARRGASGLSVWLPLRDREGVEHNLAAYHEQTPFTPAYHDFVETYARYLFAPSPPVRLVSPEPRVLVDDEGTEYYVVTVAGEDRERVFAVESVLAYSDPAHPDEAILLGIVREALYDPQTGQVVQYLPDTLPALDGHLISVFVQGGDETTAVWLVPVLLNGEEVDLVVLVDTETWEGEVAGAWPGQVEGSGVAAKELIAVQSGDRISPLFPLLTDEHEEETYVYWDEFVVGDRGPELGWEPAPPGAYWFAFVITDVHQLETYSDFVVVEYQE